MVASWKGTANSLGQADISASKLKVFNQGLRMNAGIEEHYLILRIWFWAFKKII